MARNTRRKLTLEETDTGFPKREDAQIKKIMAQTFDLLCRKWPQIRDIRDNADNSAVQFAFGVRVCAGGKLPKIKTKIRVRPNAVSDEVEEFVEDPNQTQLPLPEQEQE